MKHLKWDSNIKAIYKLTSPNGKVYIGKTTNLYSRLNNYKNLNCKSQQKIYNALIKYGYENFKVEILFETNKEYKHLNIILNALEIKAINKYNSIDNGYNIKNGGDGGKHSQETKNKIGESNKGKIRTDEFKLNISKRMKGIVHSDESNIKRSNSMVGKNQVIVFQYSKDNNFIKEWASVYDVYKELNISRTSISNNLNGRSKTAGGFIWKYKI